MTNAFDRLEAFPRAEFLRSPTPLESLPRLSDRLGIDLWIKRDDLAGLGLGGNKVRQLEYYLGAAQAAGADTVLVTGAVQSNFVRTTAAGAAKLGMKAILQLEDRVPDMSETYHRSGNVLLGKLMGAEQTFFPIGEDEHAADKAVRARAEALQAEGHTPYVIPLAPDNPPLGALGYMRCAREIVEQDSGFDVLVTASGSGQTHTGLLGGMRALGMPTTVHGICVRRAAALQTARIDGMMAGLAKMLDCAPLVEPGDILIDDTAMGAGYGRIGAPVARALTLMARSEGIVLDPVYTAKTFAGLIALVERGEISKGDRVVMIHSGGQPALFSYADEFDEMVAMG